jgi:hypothetical protein
MSVAVPEMAARLKAFKDYYQIPKLTADRSKEGLAAKLLTRIRRGDGGWTVALPPWKPGVVAPPPLPAPTPGEVAALEKMSARDLVALGQTFNDYYSVSGTISTANKAVLKAMAAGKLDDEFSKDVTRPFRFGADERTHVAAAPLPVAAAPPPPPPPAPPPQSPRGQFRPSWRSSPRSWRRRNRFPRPPRRRWRLRRRRRRWRTSVGAG